jgi:predicted membrane protein
MTRAMLSTVLARMAMIDTSSYTIRVFDDVSPDAWYGPSVAWAYEQGIVTGVGGKQFNPDANITRQEFSVMLSRFISFMNLRLKSETAAPFADEDQASTWAQTAAADMKKYGIVTGKPGNLFDPNSDITRAEITAMLYRLIEASVTYEYESDLDGALKKN